MANNQARAIAVYGAGSFGTAIAWMISDAGRSVRQWCFLDKEAAAINECKRNPFFVDHCKLDNVVATTDVLDALEGCESVVIATPSFAVVNVAAKMGSAIGYDVPVLILSKGLDLDGERLLVDAVVDKIGNRSRVAVLSGPNHAEELSRGELAGAVVASDNQKTAEYFQRLLSRSFFRLYVSDDPIGVSLCGAAKNVIAIACGMARGAGFGDNAVSLLMTRGLAEIARLVDACGGSSETCMGLAGVGDLNATCNSLHSRNGMYGEAFAKEGVGVAEYEERRHMVVEGAHAVGPLIRLAQSRGVELPVMRAVEELLGGKTTISEVSRDLMNRDLGAESLSK